MSEIAARRLYELLRDGVERCGFKTLSLGDEELEYNLFEEFDVTATSFLHDDSLARLHEAGLLSTEAQVLAREVRAAWMELQKKDWEVAEIRGGAEWGRLFLLCDELLEHLPARALD